MVAHNYSPVNILRLFQPAGKRHLAAAKGRLRPGQHPFEAGNLMLLFTDGLDALLLNPGPDSGRQRVIDTAWCKSLNPQTLQAHLQDLEHRARTTPHTDWPADDITILALEAIAPES